MGRTLFIIKPDAVQRGLGDEILGRVASAGFTVSRREQRRLSRAEVEELYREHRGKPFFDRNAAFIAGGELILCLIEGNGDIVGRVRAFIGDKDPARARKGTVRGDYGIDPAHVERNLVHGSSSVEDAERETALFFGEAGASRMDR
jgi:nucleoside-diphosphate kinase